MGHKAAECMVRIVGEIGLESEKPIGEVKNEGMVGGRSGGGFETKNGRM